MNQVQAMVENIPEARGRHGHACQLAIHRIQKRHQPAGHQARAEMPMPEQNACQDGQDIAGCRDLIGTEPQPHAPDGGPARRDRPDRPGDEVGDAFVGTVEQGLLKMRLIGVGDWRDPRRIEFAQLRLHRGGHGAGNHFA
ncbi:hypothetical protein D9M71_591130 [compost metagenome]